jgi:predicted dehydrogenase
MDSCSQFLPQLNLTPLLPNSPHHFYIILIGAGSIINLGHLPAYELANFTVKGIYDVDKQRAQEMASKWNIPTVFDTLSEACAFTSDRNIIFDIAVPSNQILPILKQLPINSYALIQKPMGECLSKAQAIVDLCEQRHIHGSINLQLRYAPYILALKDAIRRGWLGDRITTIEIHVNVLTSWSSWPFLASVPRLELPYHSVHYVDLVRDLMSPYEPTAVHCRTSRHAAMPELSSVRSSFSLEFEHDPSLYVNIYTNHHHRWGQKHAQSYILVEGTGGAAKAQIGDNLAYGESMDGKQRDYLQVNVIHSFINKWVKSFSNLFDRFDFYFHRSVRMKLPKVNGLILIYKVEIVFHMHS